VAYVGVGKMPSTASPQCNAEMCAKKCCTEEVIRRVIFVGGKLYVR